MDFYSQYGQDAVALNFFEKKGIKNGYYVDVGASDGIRLSNTYLLAKQGWKGICVEAHPSYFELLKNNRGESVCFPVAAGDKDETDAPINLNYRGSLTSLDFSLEDYFSRDYVGYYGNRNESEIKGFKNGAAIVKMRTIDSMITECEKNFGRTPNLICIDIDGSEKYAFKGLDLDRWKPEILILEHSTIGHRAVDDFAFRFKYLKAVTLGADNIYVRTKEDLDIVRAIKISGARIDTPHPAEEK
tara:strand:+ start:4260 stop:4991 length:732 start_codon:yes stop_codon:yes gene_type:complete